jgi:hypothetical protein
MSHLDFGGLTISIPPETRYAIRMAREDLNIFRRPPPPYQDVPAVRRVVLGPRPPARQDIARLRQAFLTQSHVHQFEAEKLRRVAHFLGEASSLLPVVLAAQDAAQDTQEAMKSACAKRRHFTRRPPDCRRL